MNANEVFHPVYNGKTGEVVVDLAWPVVRRYSRAKAVQVLSDGLDIRSGKRLTSINVTVAGVEATFADGQTAMRDLLVGADSANSIVRSWLFNHADLAKASDMSMVLNNMAVQFPADLALRLRSTPHPLQKLCIHPDHNVWLGIMSLQVTDVDRPDTWLFHFLISEWVEQVKPMRSEQRLQRLKAMAMDYAEPFRSAFLALDDKIPIPEDRLKYWADPRLWDNRGGRVTLAGDAAHPFPPHRGQGLNNSFQDAALLVKTVSQFETERRSIIRNDRVSRKEESSSFSEMLRAYDAEVFERGKQEIKVSYEQAYAATHFNAYLESAAVKHGLRPVPR